MTTDLYLIDERGELIRVDDLQRRLGNRMRPAETLAHIAVTQMGAIALEYRQFATVATLDDATVSHLALSGLLSAIALSPGKRLIITFVNDTSRWQSAGNRDDANRLISDLIAKRKPRPRYWRAPTQVALSPFAAKLGTAQDILAAPLDLSLQFHMIEALLAPNLISFNVVDESIGQVRMQDMSQRFRRFDPAFVEAGRGKTYHDINDHAFGRETAEALAEIVMGDIPVTEALDVTATTFGGRDVHFAYQRLALPFRRGGDRMLLVATDVVRA